MFSLLFFVQEEKSDKERWQYLVDLVDFVLVMKDIFININNQFFNNFMLRIGKGLKFVGFLFFFVGDLVNQQEGFEVWRELRYLGWGELRLQSWKGL